MYRLSTALIATIAFLVGTSARGDFIPWSYSWSSDPQVSDGAGAGVNFFTTSAGTIGNSKDVPGAVFLQPFAQDTGTGHILNDAPYKVSMHIVDQASGVPGEFAFNGKLSGDIVAGSLTNTFSGPVTQSLTLGQNQYAVTIGGYTPPGKANSDLWGQIGADVTVTGPSTPPITDVPEPTGLALGGMALLMLGGWCFSERKCLRGLAPSIS